MLVSCAYGLRRPHEAFVGYATLACWCVLLLLLPVLHPDDVSGGAAWYVGMVALLALGIVRRATWCPWLCDERVSAPARPGPARP